MCFARTSAVAALESPTACVTAFANVAVFEPSTVSPGIELNTAALDGGGSAADGASIAGGAALAATAMIVPVGGNASTCLGASVGVYGSSDEVSPVCRAGAASNGCIDCDVGCRTLHCGVGGCGTLHGGGGADGTSDGTSHGGGGGGVADDDAFEVVDG